MIVMAVAFYYQERQYQIGAAVLILVALAAWGIRRKGVGPTIRPTVE